MQAVSDLWIQNQKQTLVDESYIEIGFEIADPDALADASSSDNGSMGFSKTPQIVDGLDKSFLPYATLEHNIWPLDGSYRLLDVPGDTGFVSVSLCDKSGLFQVVPIVSVSFEQIHDKLIPGITITWSSAFDEFATDFVVTAYDGSAVVAQKTVTGNRELVSVVDIDIQGYDKIDISVLKWCLPIRRARIEDVLIGIGKTYRKKDLISFTQESLADPLVSSLPKYSISYEVDNVDNSFDLNNIQGMAKYLIERQKISVRYGYKFDNMEWISGGVYHLSEWNAPQNGIKATFKARDILEFMTRTYYKGKYSVTGVSFYDLAEEVLTDAHLPLNPDGDVSWKIDNSLKMLFTNSPLPQTSLAGCLQLISNATCSAMSFERNGRLNISPPDNEPTDYEISLFNSYRKTEVSLTKPLAGVEVKTYKYFADDRTSELFNGTVYVSGTRTMVLSYSQPAFSASVTNVSGGTIVSSVFYTYACELTITGSGNVSVIISGVALKSSEADHLLLTGEEGDIQPVRNPLITSAERAVAVAECTRDYLMSRRLLSSEWRADPRMDVLDIVLNQNQYNWNPARMTKVKYQYNGAFHGTGEGRVVL